MGTSPKPSLWSKLDDVTNVQDQRLMEWNVQTLEFALKKIVAMAGGIQSNGTDFEPLQFEEFDGSILDEVEVPAEFELPNNKTDATQSTDANTVELPTKIAIELNGFVKTIWTNYNTANPFHSTQHACHVVRSMSQLLDYLQSNTFLQRDPMAVFVILLISIVHDLDHPGT